jgi:hypothetical protein
MKRRVRKIANFFAFNLLFFALYLNFIHKDNLTVPTQPSASNSPAFSGTVLVENPTKTMELKTEAAVTTAKPAVEKSTDGSSSLRLSIN